MPQTAIPNPVTMPPTPQLPRLASSAHRPVRGLSIRSQDERRLPDFVGGQYAAYNLSSVLFEDRTDDASAIALYRWSPPAGEKPSFSEAVKHKFEKASKGDLMGPSWSNHWWKLDIAVPAKWQDKEWCIREDAAPSERPSADPHHASYACI